MYEIRHANWEYEIDMQEISKITEEVYGRGYDVAQTGEFHNGSWTGAHTDPENPWSGNWPGDYFEDGHYKPLETVSEAIEYWLAQPLPANYWERPEWQPDLSAVFADLADKGHIPHGRYFVDISW